VGRGGPWRVGRGTPPVTRASRERGDKSPPGPSKSGHLQVSGPRQTGRVMGGRSPAPPGSPETAPPAGPASSFSAWVGDLGVEHLRSRQPSPAAHSPGSTRPQAGPAPGSNGCGAYTRPPWPLIRPTNLRHGQHVGESASVRNSPNQGRRRASLPFLPRRSDPATADGPASRPPPRPAACVNGLWSVTHNRRRVRGTRCSTVEELADRARQAGLERGVRQPTTTSRTARGPRRRSGTSACGSSSGKR